MYIKIIRDIHLNKRFKRLMKTHLFRIAYVIRNEHYFFTRLFANIINT